MKPLTLMRVAGLQLFAVVASVSTLEAQASPDGPSPTFDQPADAALAAMKSRADELHVSGVAVVAYSEGDTVTAWSSKMKVVGSLTKAGSGNDKSSNLLGVAYAKASEMASTLKNSGSGVRPVYIGEFGWQGGVVARGRAGIIIVAFSGGRSEDDVRISTAGLEVLQKTF
jgi:hypothetical protein